ncbi:Hypothetical predicted protein [Olea europaea subsp. europaea]|uniref:Uncharacterized protein n=1 Tax=Olea europaea subsp. europaea TaxID=158383 RepID=A0A8S0R6K3_OLEEU|nr:Hypothetical predicted protein [Olea europaea subsp. europaea]
MGFGASRSIIRLVSRTVLFTRPASHVPCSNHSVSTTAAPPPPPWFPPSSAFHSLTDTRYPKRWPSDKPRRKRASLRPLDGHAWVKYVPGEPILPNQSNEGSVKRRNEKKQIKQHLAFILSEKKKHKAQFQEAKRKRNMQRVERKMAAVAREREWAQRLIELQQLEELKKRAFA